jgi:RHS repeat-associated protein
MTSDQNKGITSITYNHLNQPLKIIFNNNTNTRIEYFYTSSGEKVQKKVFTAASAVTTTDYLDGFQYTQTNTGMVILQFFPHAEGYVNNTVVSGANVYSYVFNYTDHLGNIRLRFTRNTNGTLRTLEQNHYYPYGMKHEKYNEDEFVFIPDPNGGYNSGVTTGRATGRQEYQYKYNGKEWQDELGLNMTAMDMRLFDNAIARWVVLDPVVHHSQTPYNGFDGNPVYWADPSGADGTNYSAEGFRGSTYDYQGRPKYNDGGFYIPAHERGMANYHYDENGMDEDFGGDNSNNGDFQTDWNINDKVSINSIIYKILDAIQGIDPNSEVKIKDYSSIEKILKSPEITNMIKEAGYKLKSNLIIDLKDLSGNYGETKKSKNGIMTGYIYKSAFNTWARLALTVIHESIHQIDYIRKRWDGGKTNLSTYKSEVSAWKNNIRLGDDAGLRDLYKYQRYIREEELRLKLLKTKL